MKEDAEPRRSKCDHLTNTSRSEDCKKDKREASHHDRPCYAGWDKNKAKLKPATIASGRARDSKEETTYIALARAARTQSDPDKHKAQARNFDVEHAFEASPCDVPHQNYLAVVPQIKQNELPWPLWLQGLKRIHR